MFIIRRARPEDSEVLTGIAERSEAHWGCDAAFMEAFRRLYRITPELIAGSVTFVAEEDGACLGFYTLLSHDDATELEYLYLEPSCIGKGLGRLLWDHMADHCRREGIPDVQLVCGPEPKRFYEKMGAIQIGETASLVVPGRRVARMRYTLEPAP